jgi:DNA polymerase III subunit delta'
MAKRAAKADAAAEAKPAGGLAAGGGDEGAAPGFTPLSAVLGQGRAVEVLHGAIGSGRVHHAWIFGGPAGVGKFTAAVGFAALLLDPATRVERGSKNGPARVIEPGSASSVQQLVRSGNHPDLHVIRKELAAMSSESDVRKRKQTNIPLEVLKEFLLKPAAMARAMAGESPAGKVFIVDQAELIDPIGQNALLKTMEEPPAGTVIILVTSNEERLLPTIRSRAQRVSFGRLDAGAMERWLEGSGLATPPGMRKWVLEYAAGSPGVATTVIRQGLHAWHAALGPMLASVDRGTFSGELGPAMAKLIDERAAEEAKATPEGSKDAANRAWSKRMLGYVATHYQGRLSGGEGGGEGLERAARAIDLVADAERQIDANVRYSDVVENLAAQLAARG